jgi:hypothetical protein
MATTALLARRETAASIAFDRDAYRAWQAIGEYLDCHDQHPDSAKSAREDAVSAIIDMLSNDEIAEAAAWAKVRAAGRVAA